MILNLDPQTVLACMTALREREVRCERLNIPLEAWRNARARLRQEVRGQVANDLSQLPARLRRFCK
jgi:hypothetical protein